MAARGGYNRRQREDHVKISISTFCLAALVALAASVAFGARAEASTITVTEIKASGSDAAVQVDDKLSEMADKLRKQFHFSKYEFLASKSTSVAVGEKATWTLATGYFVDIKLASAAADSVALDFEAYKQSGGKRESIATMTIKTAKGSTFLTVLPDQPELKGARLILAIKGE